MNPPSHERYEELAAGHALAALEPGEELEFTQHLAGCARCERTLVEHRETLAHLAYAAEPVPPPAGLIESIRAGVRQAQRTSGLGDEAPPPVSLAAARSRGQRAAARLRGMEPATRRWVGVAAAAALVLTLGVSNVVLRRSQLQSDLRTERLTAAVRLLETPSTRRVELTDDAGRPVAFAVLHLNRTVSLVVSGLAPNDDASSVYVLWQTGDAGTRPVGTFDVDPGQVVVLRDLQLARDLPTYSAFAVTRESGRHAPRLPGSLPVASGSLSA